MLRYAPLSVVAALAMLPMSGIVHGQDDPVEIKGPARLLKDVDVDVDVNGVDVDVKGKAGGTRVIVRGGDAAAAPGAFWLGLMLDPEAKGGATVVEVQPGSPAAKAGLKKGDLIVELGDKKIAGPAALAEGVKATGGKETTVTVQRGEGRVKVEVTPARRNIAIAGDELKWWKEVAPGFHRRVLLLGPGMVFPRDAARMVSPRLPEDFSFQVQGQGEDKPSKIVIKKDGKTWTVTEDKWEDIPVEIRNMLPAMHPHGITVSGPVGDLKLPPLPAAPKVRVHTFDAPAAHKVQRLEKMIEQLMRDVKELKHEHMHDHEGEDAAEDEDAESTEEARETPKTLADTIENAIRGALGGVRRVEVEVDSSRKATVKEVAEEAAEDE